MKKIALIAVMLLTISSYAEMWMHGDFEAGNLDGTVLYDHDGDGEWWHIHTDAAYSGTYGVKSISAGLTPNNTIISPQVYLEIPSQLSIMVGASDPVNFAEHFEILISFTDTDSASFVQIHEETLTSSDWKEIMIDLTPYVVAWNEFAWFANVYIAVRHFDSDNQSALLIDDIKVYHEPSYWYGDPPGVILPEGVVAPFTDLNFQWDIWDNTGLQNINLHYIISDEMGPQAEVITPMIINPDPAYSWTYINVDSIPGQPMGTFIEYWAEATEMSGYDIVGESVHFNVEWGEVPFVEDFEGGSLPEDWNVYSVLIDDFVTTWDHPWAVGEPGANAHAGSYSITSASQTNFGVYETEDYLITPRIRIDGAAKLKYYMNAQTIVGLDERYEVRVSTVSGDSADIDTYTLLFEEILLGEADDTNWHERVLDLQAYSGQFVWIMFKHLYTPTGTKLDRYLNLDDVSVSELPKVVMDENAGNACLPDNPYEFTITATDYSGIESAKLYYSIDGGGEVEVVMADNGDDTFTGAIPAQIDDTRASWYLVVTDDSPYLNSIKSDSYDVIWFTENWLEWGSSPGVYPHVPDGFGTPWIAAMDWNFGQKEFLHLNKIEARFDTDETVTWKLVEFDGVPTDNVVGTYEGVADFARNVTTEVVIDTNYTKITGHVALALEIDGGYLYLDESGDKSHAWQYTSSLGWQTNSWGAFHIRMYVSNSPDGINDGEFIANTTELCQNYPNPFNPTTSISFFSKESGKVNLAVYNVAGEKVASLVDRNLKSGYHKINFDASRLNSGVYYYTLVTPETRITKKMVLVK